MRKKTTGFRAVILLAAAGLIAAAGSGRIASWGADSTPTAGVETSYRGISKPSKDRILSFQHQGRVAEILAQVGDEVKANQLVASLDDVVEQFQLEQDQADADDTTEEDAEVANQKKDVVDQQKLRENNVGSASEIRDADLKVEIDNKRIILAKKKQEKAQIKLKGTTADLKRMKIFSPIDGVVAQSMLQPGESAESGSMRAMRIVQLDPLWVEAPVSVLQARKLKKGDPARVEFTDKSVRTGKVALVFPTGDSASSTITVRIEVPNPDKISSGENVNVTFPGGTPVARP